MEPAQEISRRDLLKLTFLAGGGLAVSGLLSTCGGSFDETGGPLRSSPTASPLPPDPTTTASLTAARLPSVATPTLADPVATLPSAASLDGYFQLPGPRLENGFPLLQALQERHSTRSFLAEELPLPTLSDLLWAAFGVNRPDGKRTAPSAHNVQDIDLYVVVAKGAFRYAADLHALVPLAAEDLRLQTGSQSFTGLAPLELVYVTDSSRMAGFGEQDRLAWSWAHTGCIAQNVYLFCAAAGLATVVRSTLDRGRLATALGLTSQQQITLVQTVGLPGAA